MKFRNALAAATMLALPLAANAQPIDGLYVGGGAGVNIMQNEDVSAAAGPLTAGGQFTPKLGGAISVSLGYGLGNGLRAEIEGNFRNNMYSGSNQGGQEQKYGAMFNVLFDFYGLVPMVTPYVGVGAGYQWTKERNVYAVSPVATARVANGTEGSWAYQGIIGAAMPIVSVPGLALTLDYRFLGLGEDRKYGGTISSATTTVATDVTFKNDFNHTILVGFRYAFGVTPPPAAPVAAPVPASPISRSYLVFFDWDKATLTDRARQIVAEAAANSTKVQYTRLEVNGYTDTSGTPKYNQGLSVRLAQAVAAELVKNGVPKSAISIQGFGETNLLVPTGPGVREPQNRRVEFIIK